MVGLIFRESAKAKRSLTSWKESKESVLPTSVAPRQLAMSTGGSTDSWEKDREDMSAGDAQRSGSQRSGMGFGRQGEKAALARGKSRTMGASTS